VFSSLPLHAAGVYDRPDPDHAGNYLVSSYTPTLTALHRLLTGTSDQGDSKTNFTNIFLVSEPDITNHPPLPNAQVEVDVVRNLLPPGCITNDPEHGIILVDQALSGAKAAHVLHLACHGFQDQENPLNSGFELHDGRLSFSQLMRLSTPHAQLAYLSACESAGMDESRPDEGLNLVGAMIFVGFKSVIGTMW
jgi:CHAT domain-containing protein